MWPKFYSRYLSSYFAKIDYFRCFLVNELPLLTEDCRYLVLLAKIQSKVNKNEEALLSLHRVSVLLFFTEGSFVHVILLISGSTVHFIDWCVWSGERCAGKGAEACSVGAAWRSAHAEAARLWDLCWNCQALQPPAWLWESRQVLQRSACVLWEWQQGQHGYISVCSVLLSLQLCLRTLSVLTVGVMGLIVGCSQKDV